MMLYIMNDFEVFKDLPSEEVLVIIFVNYEQGLKDFLMKPVTLYGVWLLEDPVFKRIKDVKSFIKENEYTEYYSGHDPSRLIEDCPYLD